MAECLHLKRAFTLIEMIVAIVILSIVSIITIHYIVSASRLYVLVYGQRQADGEAIAALNRMRREIRSVQTNLTADVDVLAFVNRNGTNMFQLSGTDLRLNGNILARDMDTFRLTYYDNNNGPLLSLPLDEAGRAAIHRVALDLRVVKGDQSSDLNVNIFYPKQGTVK